MIGSNYLEFIDYKQTTAKEAHNARAVSVQMEDLLERKALLDRNKPPYPLQTMLRIHLQKQ